MTGKGGRPGDRPVVRVGMAPPSDAPAGVNRYVLSTLLSLEEDVPRDRQLDLAALAGCTLAAYLARGSEADADEVLLIDQFEELLTVDPTAVAAKRVFFAQLGLALRDTRLWVVVAILMVVVAWFRVEGERKPEPS